MDTIVRMLLRSTTKLVLRAARRTCSRALFSTAPLSERMPEWFRTLETDPRNHSLDHEGKFYTIDDEVRNTIFKHAGFSVPYQEQLAILNETAFMIRRPALEVIHYLKTADYSTPPIRYVLYSNHIGAGITVSLAHVVHYAWLNKWLIVHLSKAYAWVRETSDDLMQLSTYNPLRLDQNREACVWLKHFKNQNEHLIDEIKLTKSYTWSKRETSEAGEPISAVIEHGLNRTAHAVDCVQVILKEIKAQSGPNSFRTLVVIDGVNALYGDVNFKRPDSTKITIDDLSLLRGFKKLLSNDWSNAAVVTSADGFADCTIPVHPVKPAKVLWPDKNPHVQIQLDISAPIVKTRKCYPKELMGSKCFNIMEPFVPVEVPKYSLKEFYSCYDYYVHMGYIQCPEGRSEEGRDELQFLSGCIPADLMRFCASL